MTIRSDVFGLSNTKHLRRNAVGIGLNTSDLTQRSGLLTRIASDLVRHAKNTLVLYRV